MAAELLQLQNVFGKYPSVPQTQLTPQQQPVVTQSVCGGQFQSDDKLYALGTQQSLAAKEAVHIGRLDECLHVGQVFVSLLYSYRAVSRGVPQAQTQEQANRTEMYRAAYLVLKPEVAKMKDLAKYCEECTGLVVSTMQALVNEYYVVKDSTPQMASGGASAAAINKVVSEGRECKEAPGAGILMALSRMLDLIIVIDMLKNSKASLNNDFSIYKRIWSNLKNLTGEVEDETMENHTLHMFLGAQNVFSQKLKDRLIKEVAGYEDLMIDVINSCASQFEARQWVRPQDKWVLLKSVVYGMWLIDFGGDEGDISKRKRLKMDRLQRIIKQNPVVPFFGDMSMTLASFFVKTPRLQGMKFEHDANDQQLQNGYKMVQQVESIRGDFLEYTLTLKASLNLFKFVLSKSSPTQYPEQEVHGVYQLLLRGLQLLSDWSARVLEQSAWKFANPTNSTQNSSVPADASLYELGVRYNYSAEERTALVEVIGIIKSLAAMLLSVEANVLECIYRHVYLSLQSFVRTTLKDMVQHVAKKKKPALAQLQQVYTIMADRFEVDLMDDGGGKKGSSAPTSPTSANSGLPTFIVSNLNSRVLAVAQTQLYYIRSLLESSTNERSKGMQGGFMKEKDFKDNHVAEVNDFIQRSFYFAAMLNFPQTVADCADLSELWYKEFYLELTKQIQFPIEMSLPWILAESVLESGAPEMIEFVLYPLDIYSDAANRALHKLKTRFLYDEIEAEVNLCFDQFIWKLSQKIFVNAKSVAAATLLDKQWKREAELRLMTSDDRFDASMLRYGHLLQQKKFSLLGRHVNIAKLVSQHCNLHMRQAIDTVISRYEASDITAIVELDKLLEQNRYAHALLSQHMHMDPFDDLLAEADEETSLVTLNGRIAVHTVHELIGDFVQTYCYNSTTSRFVRAPALMTTEVQRVSMPKALPMYVCGTKALQNAHHSVFNLYKSFVGAPHFQSMLRVLGAKHIGVLIGEVAQCAYNVMTQSVTPYVAAVTKGMPHSTKLPPVEYGFPGSFDYFTSILKPILGYRELKSGVFQAFREFGNCLLFIKFMNVALRGDEALLTIQRHPLVGEICGAVETRADPRVIVKNVLEESDTVMHTPEGGATFRQQCELMQSQAASYEPSNLVKLFDAKLQMAMQEAKVMWEANQAGPEEIQTDHSDEFYRVWSAIQFAFAIPPPTATEFTNRELFGEAVVYGASKLIFSFGEHGRFEAFDFLRQMANLLHGVDVSTLGMAGQVDLAQFAESARMISAMNVQVFRELDKAEESVDGLTAAMENAAL